MHIYIYVYIYIIKRILEYIFPLSFYVINSISAPFRVASSLAVAAFHAPWASLLLSMACHGEIGNSAVESGGWTIKKADFVGWRGLRNLILHDFMRVHGISCRYLLGFNGFCYDSEANGHSSSSQTIQPWHLKSDLHSDFPSIKVGRKWCWNTQLGNSSHNILPGNWT